MAESMAAGTRVLLRPVLARIFFHDIDLEEVTSVVEKVENVKPGMRHYVIKQVYGGRNLYAPVFKIDPKFGGIPDGEVADVEDVKWSYSFVNSSRSGRHWTRYILMIARRVVVKYRTRSNRGNYRVTVYEFTPEGLKTEEKSCQVRRARRRLEAAALVASINPSLASKIIEALNEEEERCKEQVDW